MNIGGHFGILIEKKKKKSAYELSRKSLMQLSRNSLHKLETNLSEFYFNLLLHGIQDGFVFSFRKKMYLYFQLENTLRLFEIMKIVPLSISMSTVPINKCDY